MTDAPDKLFVEREEAYSVGSTLHFYVNEDEDEIGLTSLCGAGQHRTLGDPALRLIREHQHGDDFCDFCKNTEIYNAFRKTDSRNESDLDTADSESDSSKGETQSRWERYQQWIDEQDWGNNKSPEEIRASGKLLVAPGYQRRDLDYSRRLHVYERAEGSKRYASKCGTAPTVNSDELEGRSPSSFLLRSDSCDLCAREVETTSTGAAASVDYDPFNVFDKGQREHEDLPEIPDDPEEYVCPDCGESYGTDGIGQHWGHPQTDCEYPVPSGQERELLIGLWLSGGSIEGRGTYPTLRKTSILRYPLDWLKHELGVWGVDVSASNSRTDQQSNVEKGFGHVDAGSHQQYRLTTRTCPYLADLKESDLTDVELTPTAARVLFSFRGHVIDKSAVSIRHPDGDGLVQLLQEAGFTEISLYEPSEGKNQWKVTLSAEDSRRFAEWIGGDPIPGFTQSSKQLEFRDRGPQGDKPSRRVPMDTTSDNSPVEEPDTATHTPAKISLEPDWEWLGTCLAKLESPQLARKAFEQDLSPNEVYGDILDRIHANRHKLPTPAEVASAEA